MNEKNKTTGCWFFHKAPPLHFRNWHEKTCAKVIPFSIAHVFRVFLAIRISQYVSVLTVFFICPSFFFEPLHMCNKCSQLVGAYTYWWVGGIFGRSGDQAQRKNEQVHSEGTDLPNIRKLNSVVLEISPYQRLTRETCNSTFRPLVSDLRSRV